MNIRINGKEKNIKNQNASVTDILLLNGVQSIEMVTVQLNGSFLAKKEWETTLIKEKDEIDFLYFMGGGA